MSSEVGSLAVDLLTAGNVANVLLLFGFTISSFAVATVGTGAGDSAKLPWSTSIVAGIWIGGEATCLHGALNLDIGRRGNYLPFVWIIRVLLNLLRHYLAITANLNGLNRTERTHLSIGWVGNELA